MHFLNPSCYVCQLLYYITLLDSSLNSSSLNAATRTANRDTQLKQQLLSRSENVGNIQTKNKDDCDAEFLPYSSSPSIVVPLASLRSMFSTWVQPFLENTIRRSKANSFECSCQLACLLIATCKQFGRRFARRLCDSSRSTRRCSHLFAWQLWWAPRYWQYFVDIRRRVQRCVLAARRCGGRWVLAALKVKKRRKRSDLIA